MAGVGMKDIKRRMKSVTNTKQITKAMELVASAKLKRAKEKAEVSRPYFETLYATIEKIAQNTKGIQSIYLEERESKNKCYIVIAGDRGLAGGYNSNVLKTAVNHMNGKKEKIISVGKKSVDFFSKKGYELIGEVTGVEDLNYSNARKIADIVIDAYENNEIDEVYLVYTKFVSTLTQEPKVLKLLPLSFEENKESKKGEVIEFDPCEETVLDLIVPKFIAGSIYGGIVESSASEQGARRTAMESATDNADDMLAKLELSYNRARQASITQEISEIVAGAEALK
ncbi:ATP synthase F1 subunit gamma [Tepidibacter formicigenes]|jgi:F-type H+-transporting ATPase subunit gamma|uniref:ATP synthase gamma chain n=1 Tax=Tepidibacter formicigenes DSM 15518 TaxID=1123349 RepID=A0A1M6MRB3_9FIRM|nr:ATP synthase F1 subunit gamma [Tepidibacter formicigenes]SHJ85946.1 F-type H+-transporting ATPase subunit gamma [Tepidibacter formicigenes DSM 15518]